MQVACVVQDSDLLLGEQAVDRSQIVLELLAWKAKVLLANVRPQTQQARPAAGSAPSSSPTWNGVYVSKKAANKEPTGLLAAPRPAALTPVRQQHLSTGSPQRGD